MAKVDLPIVFTNDRNIDRIQQNIRTSLLNIQRNLTSGSVDYFCVFSGDGLSSKSLYYQDDCVQVSTAIVSNQLDTTTVVDLNKSNTQVITLTANQTIELRNQVSGGQYVLALVQDSVGGRSITSWIGNIKWQAGAVAPSATANKTTLYNIVCIDNYCLIKSDGIGY